MVVGCQKQFKRIIIVLGQIFQKQGSRKHCKMNEGKEARQGAKAGKSPTGGALETVRATGQRRWSIETLGMDDLRHAIAA